MAEESQAFVAQNTARAAAYEEHQIEMTAKAQEATQAPQASSVQAKQAEKDS
eukprot:gene5319-5202_t